MKEVMQAIDKVHSFYDDSNSQYPLIKHNGSLEVQTLDLYNENSLCNQQNLTQENQDKSDSLLIERGEYNIRTEDHQNPVVS